MKMFLVLIALLAGLNATAGTPVVTQVPIEEVYVPSGFDSNDNSQIVIEGWLPNLCHKTPTTSFKIRGKTIDITLTALRYDSTNPYCPEVIVPFIETVDLGLLDAGTYRVLVNGRSVHRRTSFVRIAPSTSDAIDNFVYANVEYIDKELYSRKVTLKGSNPSSCFELQRVLITDNRINTYAIMPIMRRVRDFCPQKMVPFEYEITIPDRLLRDKVLLHVRSMNGKSVNTLLRVID